MTRRPGAVAHHQSP